MTPAEKTDKLMAAGAKALDSLAKGFPPPEPKKTALDYLDAAGAWNACRYWSDDWTACRNKAGGDFVVKIPLPTGIVTLTKATARRGLKLLAAQAAKLEGEQRFQTKHGVAFTCESPGRVLDGFANGGSEYTDIVMQYGAFGGCIFG